MFVSWIFLLIIGAACFGGCTGEAEAGFFAHGKAGN